MTKKKLQKQSHFHLGDIKYSDYKSFPFYNCNHVFPLSALVCSGFSGKYSTSVYSIFHLNVKNCYFVSCWCCKYPHVCVVTCWTGVASRNSELTGIYFGPGRGQKLQVTSFSHIELGSILPRT